MDIAAFLVIPCHHVFFHVPLSRAPIVPPSPDTLHCRQIKSGAETFVPNRFGETALSYAIEHHPRLAKLMLDQRRDERKDEDTINSKEITAVYRLTGIDRPAPSQLPGSAVPSSPDGDDADWLGRKPRSNSVASESAFAIFRSRSNSVAPAPSPKLIPGLARNGSVTSVMATGSLFRKEDKHHETVVYLIPGLGRFHEGTDSLCRRQFRIFNLFSVSDAVKEHDHLSVYEIPTDAPRSPRSGFTLVFKDFEMTLRAGRLCTKRWRCHRCSCC